MTRRARIMNKFQITEISAVDEPCQAHARAAIMKRAAPGAPTPKDNPMSDQIKKALGLEATASDDQVAAAIAKNLAEAETLAKKATLSDATRAHYEALAKANDKEATDFLDKDEEERKKEVAKAASSDETFTSVDGQTISKAAVGGAFAILKAQDQRLRDQSAEIAKAKDDALSATIAKRVETEFSALPGSDTERTALLKFLQTAPAEVQKTADAIFKSAQDANAGDFKKSSHSNGKPEDKTSAEEQLNALAKKHQEEKGTTFAKAMDDVLKTAEGEKLYAATL